MMYSAMLTTTESAPISDAAHSLVSVSTLAAVVLALCAIFTIVAKILDNRQKHAKEAQAALRETDKTLRDAEKKLVDKDVAELKHDMKNASTKVEVLERRSGDDQVRMAKMEAGMISIKDSQSRIEAEIKDFRSDLKMEMNKNRDEVVQSIREIRNVSKKED